MSEQDECFQNIFLDTTYEEDEDMVLMRSKTDTELKYLKELVEHVLLERGIINNNEEHF
jgi:hypothetical protein